MFDVLKAYYKYLYRMLIEMCCMCGFVHRDDRIVVDGKPYRAYKPHYHWTPATGEVEKNGYTLHATVCAECLWSVYTGAMNWKEFFEQKNKTPEKYRVNGSLNAPLPERYVEWASSVYVNQSAYFQFE